MKCETKMPTNEEMQASILAEEYARKVLRGDTSIYNGVTKNVCRCGICQGPVDRIGGPEFVTGFSDLEAARKWGMACFECQANPCHVADTMTGIFTDLTFPEKSGEN